MMIEHDPGVRAVEATLFASEEPMTVEQIGAYVGDAIDVAAALASLEAHYQGRGVELVKRGKSWHFQTAADLAHLLRREREESRKLSRAAVETLAIIAYHEPVSRAEIEAIRGVQISKGTLDVLMECGWVRPAGRREVPGRPLIYATTGEFLTHLGLPRGVTCQALPTSKPPVCLIRSILHWKVCAKAMPLPMAICPRAATANWKSHNKAPT